jgi:hypothetical protein
MIALVIKWKKFHKSTETAMACQFPTKRGFNSSDASLRQLMSTARSLP